MQHLRDDDLSYEHHHAHLENLIHDLAARLELPGYLVQLEDDEDEQDGTEETFECTLG